MPVEAVEFGVGHSDKRPFDGFDGKEVARCIKHQSAVAKNVKYEVRTRVLKKFMDSGIRKKAFKSKALYK